MISLTLIDGYAFANAASVARSDANSTGDELQWAKVIVVAFCAFGVAEPPVFADVAPAVIPATRITSAVTLRNETRAPLTIASLDGG